MIYQAGKRRQAMDLREPERPLVIVWKVGGQRLRAPERLGGPTSRRIVEQDFRRFAGLS